MFLSLSNRKKGGPYYYDMYLDSDFFDMEIAASVQHIPCVSSVAHSLPTVREYGTTASSKVPFAPERKKEFRHVDVHLKPQANHMVTLFLRHF